MILLPDRYTKRIVEIKVQRCFVVYADFQRRLTLGTVKTQADAIVMLDKIDRDNDAKRLLGAAYNKGSEMRAKADEKRFESEHDDRVEARLEERRRSDG